MPRYKVDFKGVGDVKKDLGIATAAKLRKRIDLDLAEGVDDMAEGSFQIAPVDTGALRNSILASVHKEAPLTYVYGSHLPYAQRQEYEHVPFGAYFRKSIWEHTPLLHDKLEYTVRRTLGG